MTKVCQAAGKRFRHWRETTEAKEIIKCFEESVIFFDDRGNGPQKKLPQAKKRLQIYKGNGFEQGTFACPDLALVIAQWASIPFMVQVSRWIRELLSTGHVELGKEKTAHNPNQYAAD